MPIDLRNDNLNTALHKLKAKEETYKKLEAIANLGSWELDLTTGLTSWSKHNYTIFGEDEDFQPTLEYFMARIIPQDLPKIQKTLASVSSTTGVVTQYVTIKRTDSQIRHLFISAQAIFEKDGSVVKVLGTTQDISKQKELEQQTEELSQIIENSSNEIYIIKRETYEYLYVNKGGCDALGYTKEEFLKMSIYEVNPKLTQEEIIKLNQEISQNNRTLNRTLHRRKDGSTYHAQSLIHPLQYKGEDALVIFDVNISQQIEDELRLKEQAKLLDYQANHDALTSLPNRALFQDRLEQSIVSAKRNKEKFALLFIDLDQFKQINDSLGHHIGDEVLIQTASRLAETIREEDTLARLGGDEFTIILKNIHDVQGAATVASKITEIIKMPIIVNSNTLYISSSIGISLCPDDSTSKENLIKFADTAMYKAKEEGRDNYQFYSSEMTTFAFERVVMESSLRIAIKEEQFVVYFQPQFDIGTNLIVGMEALVRWNHPEIGLVSPAKFIPIAEESGLIIEIDKLVMIQAMKQVALWYKKGLKPGILALNLSMKQLNDKGFIPYLLQCMKDTMFEPTWLELEVTEGQVMSNPENSIIKLHKLHSLGIEIAIDDFGTGYSSLSYLKKLPLDKLKIDQSFVRDIPVDEDDMAITKAIIALGKSLNLKLIAEGVETEEQKDFLIENGCELVQGYLFSRPLPADAMEELLQESI